MNDKFNEQKDTLIAIKKEISLLHQQVDYLIRNEKPLELLDLDVMMNRTHTIYDLMCGVEVESGEWGMENEEVLPDEADTIRAMFGIEDKSEETTEEPEPVEEEPFKKELIKEEEQVEETPIEEEPIEEEPVEEEPIEEEPIEEEPVEEEPVETDEETPVEEPMEDNIEENEDAYFVDEVDDNIEETTEEEPVEEPIEEPSEEETIEEEIIEEKPIEEEPVKEETKDDFGFILNFEPTSSVFTTGDEIEMEIPHTEPEEMRNIEEENIPNSPNSPNFQNEEIPYEPVIFGNMTEKEDAGFELDTPETLGEKLQQEEDHSLAAKLQHSTVNDLRKAIGINEKFLLVNELFSGSMEKYNKSIENLNDLKTLNGALIYMNELRIELQWNSNNEAYKKLLELVHRKYEA